MHLITRTKPLLRPLLLYAGLPLLVLALGTYPERPLMKEVISLTTIIAFCLMAGQIYWSRINRRIVETLRMSSVKYLHEVIGYICIAILTLHPFLIVAPHYLTKSLTPFEAFVTILTTLPNKGILLGIIAWLLMVTLFLTSLLRHLMPMRYKTWRTMHGLIAMLFIVTGAWHAVNLGRHVSPAFTAVVTLLAGSGVLILLYNYISQPVNQEIRK